MAVPSNIIVGPMVDIRLGHLGLSVEDTSEALRVGFTHAAGCTEHDPRSLAGTLIWGKGIGHLRDRTKTRGWRADRAMNYETVVHPLNTYAVAIAAGDSATGREGVPPRTRRPKGPATLRAVTQNSAQLQLWRLTDLLDASERDVDDDERLTWLLLHYFDPDGGEIRNELSCPLEMTDSHISAWRERIILPAVPFGTELKIPFDDVEDESIEIDVQRKAD